MLFALLFLGALAAPQAASGQSVTVYVTVEKVRALDCMEGSVPVWGGFQCRSDPDFYSVIFIGDESRSSVNRVGNFFDRGEISPDWQFPLKIDAARGSVPVSIEIWDHDQRIGDAPPDDRVDIDGANGGEGGGRNLNLTVDLQRCTRREDGGVSGDVNGRCGETLTSGGTDQDRAEISFKIEVEAEPFAPGLRLWCVHTPALPQEDKFTVVAQSTDDQRARRVVEAIEIFVNDRTQPAKTCANEAACTFERPPSTDPTIAYGCRARAGGQEVWSGWRTVSNEKLSDGGGRAIPVLLTGPRGSRLDVVFIADRGSFTDFKDPNFLNAVRLNITGGYFGEPLYAEHQHLFNFWIATDTASARGSRPIRLNNSLLGAFCDMDEPANWTATYSFADVGAIVHTKDIRDCAIRDRRLFSFKSDDGGRLRHETGHAPFGLADEYCCDGGYFDASPHPNLYRTREACEADAPNLNRQPSDCRSFRQDYPSPLYAVWFISEPESDDLMNDNRTPRAADVRRIRWFFEECTRGGRC